MSINTVIILVTVLVSFVASRNLSIYYKFIFSPYQVIHRNKWYQIITHGFLHDKSNWLHLVFNMYVLYSFGSHLLINLSYYSTTLPSNLWYLLLYFGGITAATLPALVKHKDNHAYHALGASGGVSAIVFSSIVFSPISGGIGLIFLPFMSLPPVVFGALYLAYEIYMDKQKKTTIAHDAHIFGAIYGFSFTFIFINKARLLFLGELIGLFK